MAEERRRKVREIQAVVADVREETHDAASLLLDIGDEERDYKAGQFITIDPHQFGFLEQVIAYLEEVKGTREKPRAYSMGSAPHEPHILITVKEERFWPGESKYPPVLSPPLSRHCPPGTTLTISGFTGPYAIPQDAGQKADTVLHLCAGSGIVPNFGLIKDSIHRGDDLHHVLLYSSKTRSDIFYYDQFAALAAAHSEQLTVLHSLTREDPHQIEPASRKGRLDAELIKSYVKDLDRTLVYCCGPGVLPWERKEARERGEEPVPKFVETMVQILHELGFDKRQIKQESWG
ncbi:MAG: oxidoreductase [Candidatus Latescibacterota bacterium]|nr:oxidoreductase [Candidatus Latescibacterota bacterium]MEC8990519.1 oxidoreductase [Candidatus Latescibacterota bacterium]MEC9378948.1 oxidoreductase [Candidatus Latescibacterota bacterium]